MNVEYALNHTPREALTKAMTGEPIRAFNKVIKKDYWHQEAVQWLTDYPL